MTGTEQVNCSQGKSQETSGEWLNGCPNPGKKREGGKKKRSNKKELISRLIKNMFVLQLV